MLFEHIEAEKNLIRTIIKLQNKQFCKTIKCSKHTGIVLCNLQKGINYEFKIKD